MAASKAANTEFLSKIPNRKKISNEDFNLCEEETSLDEIIKSNINYQTSNIPPGNDGFKAVFCRIISVTSQKSDKKDIENHRLTSFFNLYYKSFLKVTSATKLFFAIK